MSLKPLPSTKQTKKNLTELESAYSPQEARVESERCLYCYDAPCIAACPTAIDIPGFIKKIASGNLTGSARTILQANALGGSCARVCPTTVLCEGACVLLDRDQQPIKIGRLQRYATDHVAENNIKVLQVPARKSGKKVAVLGGGPAGLSCAAVLAQLGHRVTIFEKRKNAGGLNTYGIAYYKLRPETSLAEVELVRSLGVKIRTGVEVGKDIKLAQLEKQFDALFLGFGLGRTRRLDIPGEDLPGVYEALDYIELIHTQPLHKVPVGRRVAVIGCGNTAIDAATQAKRLGAEEVVIIYRRGESDMPAYRYEYELAKSDGCSFRFHTLPVEAMGTNGRLAALKLVHAKADKKDAYIEPFDMLIKALGQQPQVAFLKKLLPRLKVDQNGAITRDPETGQTNLKNVFTGGDCANGGREVVNAVAEGKQAAQGIHSFLAGPIVGLKPALRRAGFTPAIRTSHA